MTENETIEFAVLFQCERCLRYFVPGDSVSGLVVLDPQPVCLSLIPDSFLCDRADCADVVSHRLQEDRRRELARAERRRRRVQSQGNARAERIVGPVRSSCPPHDNDFTAEDERRLNEISIVTPAHGEQVKAFQVSAEAARRDGEVFALLEASFDGVRPGVWVTHQVIKERAGIDAVNSSLARIRASTLGKGVDVDSEVCVVRNGKQYWQYRLCKVEDSLRLKREAKRRSDQNQKEF